MQRSQANILERIEKRRAVDMMGFEWPCYIDALDWDNAKPFHKGEVGKDTWEDRRVKTPDDVREAMIKYMEFAWEKANGFRGISAQRSIMHYLAWAWLLDDEFYQKLQKQWDENYEYYGKNILVMICEYLGLDSNKWDDGVRKNDEE